MKVARLLAAAILVAIAFAGPPSLTTSPSIPEPTESMKAEVRPVARAVSAMSAVDRLWLQYIYQNAAKITKASPAIETTDGLRAVHVAILSFIWRGMADNSPGKYPALKDAIEGAFNSTIGDSRQGLTPEMREKAAELFEAIAWAGLGKDG